MNRETKTCQNCKQSFVIESEDFNFYEKIKVPPPTWCPECRFMRRMSWRNQWHLFKKTDARTGGKIFSIFPEESPIKIYDKDYWNSDAWDPMAYGRDYDFSRPFFAQFRELMLAVPFPAHSMLNLVNCQYCANGIDLKNCYLVRAATRTEDSAYLIWDHASKQCMDCHMTDRCELSYGNLNVARSFKTLFSVDCEDCSEVILSKDCIGCTNCVGCIGLRNKSYYFWNERCTKEEYAKKLVELNLGSWEGFTAAMNHAHAFWRTFPHKYIHGRQNVGSTGDYLYETKNAKQCFRVRECEDVKFCQNTLSGPLHDVYDYANWGEGAELMYECLICAGGCARLRFCAQCYPNNQDLEYCVFSRKSSNCFGCVGLKDKQYCILNKQYTKTEYETLVPKIRTHMTTMAYRDSAGHIFAYGEFFPPEFSPFPYQITEAYELFSPNEQKAREWGFVSYPIKKEEYQPTLPPRKISDHIKDIPNSILQEIIGCVHGGTCPHECTTAFRIIPQELELCRTLGIPIPRLCPNCRHYERLVYRNPPHLWHRTCTCAGQTSETSKNSSAYANTAPHFHGTEHCPNEFETSYAPELPAIVYCEQCYNTEVA